jgi:preprotein translocase subunit SecA
MIQEDLSNLRDVQYQHANVAESETQNSSVAVPMMNKIMNTAPKVGRNDACPCGSGKKYKHCHGQVA